MKPFRFFFMLLILPAVLNQTVHAAAPTATTQAATNITSSSATLNALANPGGANTSVTFAYGTTTNYGSLTAATSIGSNQKTQSVSVLITGLAAGVTYHFQAFATNNKGSATGGNRTFTTTVSAVAPTATTQPASSVSASGATLNASVNSGGAATTVTFNYGTTIGYGSSVVTNVGAGQTALAVNLPISSLAAGTTYHFRVVATNSQGTATGGDMTFTTPVNTVAPTATTQPANNLSALSATLNALVNPGGAATTVTFNYGTTTGYGNSVVTNAGSGQTALAVNLPITGLSAGTTYHFRVVATNSLGTATGGDMSFTTPTVGALFVEVGTGLPGMTYSAATAADFDNDGRVDILLTGADASFNLRSEVWRNLGNAAFAKVNTSLPGVSSSAVARGDFDNDSKVDFLLTGFAGLDASQRPTYLSQVWRNLGGGMFGNANVALPGVDTSSVAWGDFDNDGLADVLLTGFSTSGAIAQVWRNLGNGAFANINAGLSGVLESSVAWADFDSDGKLDILLTGTTNGFGEGAITEVWRNAGNGNYVRLNAGLPGVTKSAVACSDFDGDGKLDVLLTGYSGGVPITQIWRNLGNGTFANSNAGLPGVQDSAVALADYDNDGKLDILLTGADANGNPLSQVWRNAGNGAFVSVNAGLAGVHAGAAVWADFDNDGKLDILLTGFDSSQTPLARVYRNTAAVSGNSPLRITALTPLGDGSRQLSFTGAAGSAYTVQASTNLSNWSGIGTANETSPGVFEFRDTTAANLSMRFYRLSTP